MNLIHRLLGRRPQRAADVPSFVPSIRDASRRELLTMALRDTLRRHGIPLSWITAEAGPALTPRRERGVHLRLVARHWHPALASCVVALQKSVTDRLGRLDPLSREWLVGVSWKFAPEDDTLCPALPSADYWQGVMAKPATVPSPARQRVPAARQMLDRILAEGDRAFAAEDPEAFKATRPMLHA